MGLKACGAPGRIRLLRRSSVGPGVCHGAIPSIPAIRTGVSPTIQGAVARAGARIRAGASQRAVDASAVEVSVAGERHVRGAVAGGSAALQAAVASRSARLPGARPGWRRLAAGDSPIHVRHTEPTVRRRQVLATARLARASAGVGAAGKHAHARRSDGGAGEPGAHARVARVGAGAGVGSHVGRRVDGGGRRRARAASDKRCGEYPSAAQMKGLHAANDRMWRRNGNQPGPGKALSGPIPMPS